jgi:hypothetical protein
VNAHATPYERMSCDVKCPKAVCVVERKQWR